MPNSSARCAQLPRAVDKVPFYTALKKFRDHLRGDLPELDPAELSFPEVKLQNFNNKRIKEVSEEGETGDMGEGDTRVDPDTGKKRRGRPPKPRPDGTVPPPKRKRVDEFGNPLPKGSNPIDPVTGKKKRGRPKKCDMLPMAAGLAGPGPPPGPPNGLPPFPMKEEEPDCPLPTSKTPTRLPPFSPNFARTGQGLGPGKDTDSEGAGSMGGRGSPRPSSSARGGRVTLGKVPHF